MLDNEYVAGLFDADGSVFLMFSISRNKTTTNYYVHTVVNFSGISHVYKPSGLLQQWFENKLGVYVEPRMKGKYSPKHTQQYQIRLGKTDSKLFWEHMKDLIHVRRYLFETCLDIEYASNSKYLYTDQNRHEYARKRYQNEYKEFQYVSKFEYSDVLSPQRLAGLFDADGTVSVYENRLQLQLASYDLPLLLAVQSQFAGDVRETSKGFYTLRFRYSSRHNYEAWHFMQAILPYCHEKQRALKHALYYLDSKGHSP